LGKPSSCPYISVALETLGCKLNQAETEKLADELSAAGCRMVSGDQTADLYILNTCTVTHIADRKSRHFIRQAHRLNPLAYVVVIGCYAERAAAEVAAIEGVDLVIGNSQKSQLVEILRSAGYIRPSGTNQQTTIHNRTRSFIKAQDGCNNFCSYCIVPLVRGREKSLPLEQVIDEIKRRTASGFHEVVLTGTEIGRYQAEGLDIRGLLERILRETSVSRLRLSSLQPEEITSGLVDLWRNSRLCPHFHISLQSGSDGVLKRMNRHYTIREYEEKIEMLRRQIPDVAVTTDVIVGFPGETEAEFAECYAFCRRIRFSRLHVFPFSARQGTSASVMPGQIGPFIKKERSQKMLKLAGDSLQEFNSRFIGRILEVLFEQPSAGGYFTGLTGNYIKVHVHFKADLTNLVLPVKMVRTYRDGLLGDVSNMQKYLLNKNAQE
jgi:threonylcarbamoyladenosine tRNA methylthiotransferase MtaB